MAKPPVAARLAAAPRYHESLQDLPPEVAQALLGRGSQRQWRRGEIVLRQGQALDAVAVCLQGRMAVMLADPSGHDTLLRWLDEGEMVGMPAVLAGTPFPVSIVARGPCRTLHVGRAAFIDILRRHPDGAIGIAVLLSNRLAELFRFVEMTSNRPLAERVTYALSRLARQQRADGGSRASGTIELKITQAELAMAAGGSRQRVQMELKRLQAQGVVELGYGTIRVITARL